MSPEQVEHFLLLMKRSKADGDMLSRARRADPDNEYPYIRGLNGGLELALMLFAKAQAFDPDRPKRITVVYPDVFGPHRCTLVSPDGEWIVATAEHTT